MVNDPVAIDEIPHRLGRAIPAPPLLPGLVDIRKQLLGIHTRERSGAFLEPRFHPLGIVVCPDTFLSGWWNSPASTDTFTLRCASFSHCILLEAHWASVAQRGVYPPPVVEAFDVLEDHRLGDPPTGKPRPAHQLRLQRRHEALRDGVVQRGAYPAHRGDDADLLEPLPKR